MLDVATEKLLHSIFHTLAYADVFDYPLRAPEVYRYLTSTKASIEEVARALADESLFSRSGEFFTLRGRDEIVETRRRREQVAVRLWPKAALRADPRKASLRENGRHYWFPGHE